MPRRRHLGRMLDAQESQRIVECAGPLAQETVGDSLGYGNIYYALARHLRPSHALVIGSGKGFTPAIVAKALEHNGLGRLTFVDPSMDGSRDGFNAAHGGTGSWDTPEQVRARFECAGVRSGIVTHYKLTNREFFERWSQLGLERFDFAIIDGAHDYDNALYDLNAVVQHMALPGYVLMHDSTHFFNRTCHMGVARVVEQARQVSAEMVSFPGAAGLTLLHVTEPFELLPVRRLPPTPVWLWGGLAIGLGVGLGWWLRGNTR